MGLVSRIFLAVFFIVATNAAQIYPGTSSRPILSAAEAGTLTKDAYLQGWTVEDITIPSIPDYVVGDGQKYTDIQAAANAAMNAGGSTRKYIKILPGTYAQTVFITKKALITLYGSGDNPSDVQIVLNQPASLSVSNWIAQVNPNGSRYQSTDPAFSLYNQCARRNGTIGTTCTSVVWITAPNIQIFNLQIQNSNNQSGDAQAVALKIQADKARISQVNLISRQDTLYSGSGAAGVIERVFVDNTYIEGDVDFVFGGASTIFLNCTFLAVSDRHPSSAIVFAPNTHANNTYGFLVQDSVISGDSGFQSNKKVSLARSWDSNTPSGSYVPDTSPNGQLLIRTTQINLVVNVAAPYSGSTSSRAYSGDVASDRNLNDNTYNRFWEYQNSGGGS